MVRALRYAPLGNADRTDKYLPYDVRQRYDLFPDMGIFVAAPVPAFCRAASGKIKQADYILVHYTSGKYENAAAEMDSLLGITRSSFKSVRCRVGKFKQVK